MCSCSDASMLLSQSSKLLIFPSFYRSSSRFRCVLSDRMAIPRHARSVTASIGNAMVAVAGGPTAAHAAVSAAITHVAVTAVAIASGACLSTRVECLWPKTEEQPDSLILDGVDVTGYPIFEDIQVQKAITFARKAHFGQSRKTGEPYVTHCIHTGKILAALVPSSGKRAVNTVVAGILHDVIDDTFENLSNIEKIFGADVAHLVAGVSKLSFINQLLRRHRRETVSQSTITAEEASNLRVMLLGMVDDPRAVLIKLADRLHNMRTIYALPLPKAQAVAEETLAVWCSLASRLGIWALKAELEDLCFAVLQPHTFRKMRAELASLWKPSNRTKYCRRLSVKVGCHLEHQNADQISNFDVSTSSYEGEKMEDLLQAVLPFDILLDRRKQTNFLNNHRNATHVSETKSEVVTNAGIALESLAVCEEALQRELLISNSYIPGLEVTLSSRLKSIYSIYCKMKRKGVSISDVYDARALRVVVGDKNGKLHGPAVKSCYSILDIVHRLWTPMDGEFDDYIINPKPSGYQSLHTAVQGPDGAPIEVQIRSQRMHEYAEFGLAAHWLYKENNVEIKSPVCDSMACSTSPSCHMNCIESKGYIHDDLKYSSIKVGHPVLRVEGSQLLAAVIVSVDKSGKELLVAVSFALEASEAVAERRHSFQEKRWEAYARLYKKVSDQWWFAAGHGDWCTCLEKYTLCQDKIFHKQDQFQRMLPTFIQIIDLTEQEESEYWRVMTSVFEGKSSEAVPSPSKLTDRSYTPSPTVNGINNKVHLLRTMLQWEEQVRQTQQCRESVSVALGEVVIVRWPYGDIVRMAAGSTAADVARRLGLDGKLVLVNGQLVLPHTELKDGDIVEVRT